MLSDILPKYSKGKYYVFYTICTELLDLIDTLFPLKVYLKMLVKIKNYTSLRVKIYKMNKLSSDLHILIITKPPLTFGTAPYKIIDLLLV